jgi:4-amino-4-deoxy-L-arabinose transferase-like glycosyltransferase
LIQILAGTIAWPLRPRAEGSIVGALAVLAVAGFIVWHGHTVYEPFVERGIFMSAGNDPLGYEGAARDIMEFGLLMNSGRPPGTGNAFAFYPFYPYVLAGVHWLIGDDGSAVLLANTFLIASTLLLLWFLGWRHLPGIIAAIAALAFGAFLYRQAFLYTEHAFTDNLFLPMFFAALASVVWAVRARGAIAPSIFAGVICALGAETRPSLLTLFPILLPMLLFGLRDWTWMRRASLIAALIIGFVLGLAPFALRNRIVSGQTVVASSSWIQLPFFLVPPEESNAVAARFAAPPTPRESLAVVAEIVREHPWRSFTIEARKLLFTMGFTNLSGESRLKLKPEFVVATLMGIIALLRRQVPSPLALVGAAFAISHVGAMLTAAPWTYGYKSILPFQALTLFWAPFVLLRSAAAPASEPQPSLPHVGEEAPVR